MFSNEPIEAVQQFFGLDYPMVFHVLSLPGGVWGMLLVLGIGRWLGGREAVYATLGAIIVATAIKEGIGMILDVPRPEGPDIMVYKDIEISSFPSGHTMVATVAWGSLWSQRILPLWIPLAVAGAVSLGRVYLGVHYVTDVVGGFLLALPVLFAYHTVWRHLWPWLRRRSFSFWCVWGVAFVVGTLPALAIAPDNPRRWEIVGLALGTVLALMIEHRYLPAGVVRSGPSAALAVAVGLTGAALLIALDWLTEEMLPLGLVMVALTAFWVLLVAPRSFTALGWTHGHPQGSAARST